MNKFLNVVVNIITLHPTVRKASTALIVTLAGGLGTSLSDGHLSWSEVGVSVGASLVASAAVWKTSNNNFPGGPAANQ